MLQVLYRARWIAIGQSHRYLQVLYRSFAEGDEWSIRWAHAVLYRARWMVNRAVISACLQFPAIADEYNIPLSKHAQNLSSCWMISRYFYSDCRWCDGLATDLGPRKARRARQGSARQGERLMVDLVVGAVWRRRGRTAKNSDGAPRLASGRSPLHGVQLILKPSTTSKPHRGFIEPSSTTLAAI